MSTAPPSHAPTASPLLIAREGHVWRLPDLREAWRYRELLWVFAARDIRVRYKQAVIGVAWAVVQPLFTMVAFTIVARIGSLSTDGLPPEVFYFCGMLPWLLFSSSVSSAADSLVANQDLITKVYFPRLILPAAAIATALVDFAVSFVFLLGLMAAYRVVPPVQLLLLPLVAGLGVLTALGFGFWWSALTVRFRDVRHVTPFLLQLWLFGTPVLYSAAAVHHAWPRALLELNPMTGVVEGFRWCMLGRGSPCRALAASAVTTIGVLASSLFYFRRVERTLADDL
ncbi:MAG TPA: ABC transporter permease [Polyangiaceae bacterium]|jgi:lipopolysaccharide transport system permease protein